MTAPAIGRAGHARSGWRDATVTVVVAIVAAGALVAWGLSPAAHYLRHSPDAGHPPGPALVAAFTLAWLLMSAATMLPTATPLVAAVRRVSAARPRRGALTAATIAGFLSVWTLSGLVLATLDLGLHEASERPAVEPHVWLILPATLALAGTYQLSALAARCLRACRSSFGFLARHWTGGRDVARQALTIGADYGRSCLGCCAPLMVVMFALGMGNPVWMVLATALSWLQKRLPRGTALSRPIGYALLAWAAVVAAPHALGLA
ncbi:MAG: DUF2182 domain-containing protein [Frankiaceae bacterium]